MQGPFCEKAIVPRMNKRRNGFTSVSVKLGSVPLRSCFSIGWFFVLAMQLKLSV
jgi:hypothetical protein